MKVDKKNIENIISLTPLQEGILFHYLKAPHSDYYFEQLSLEISGEIDKKFFEKAWNVVIETNEMLRTVFRWDKLENPIQVILREYKIQPGYYDLSGKGGREKKKLLEDLKTRDRNKKFNLREVPFRVTLIRTGKSKYELVISNHHIIYDGWSNGIILEEFFKSYHHLSRGKELAKPVKTKFKEFLKWIHEQPRDEHEKFWRNHLKGFDSQTELSIKSRNTRNTRGTGKYQIRLEDNLKSRWEHFVKTHKITLASLLYSSWGLLLHKYNNSDDVIFGTVVSGRSAKIERIEGIVGLFINTIPLRINTWGKDKIGDVLDRVHNTLQLRKEYENTPLVDIKKYSQSDHTKELFDSIVIIENYPPGSRSMPANSQLSIDSYSVFEMTHYDLSVSIEMFNEIGFIFTYNKEVFNENIIERLSHHFRGIVKKIITDPGLEIWELEIASDQEKYRVLYEFNRATAELPAEKTIVGLFEEQVKKTPDNTALVGKGEYGAQGIETRFIASTPGKWIIQVTYKELNRNIDQLARKLIEKGIKANNIVAIMMERSIEMVIAILGILKASGAYMPIVPNSPGERLKYLLEDSNAHLLVTTETLAKEGEKDTVKRVKGEKILLYPPRGKHLRSATNHLPPLVNAPAASLAYIIYTSGSTGRPKGVMVEQTSVVNVLTALQKQYPFKERDVYLFKSSVVFDVSVTELFCWFFANRLVLLETGAEKDPGKILDTIATAGVTHINFVPSMFNVFVEVLNQQNITKLSGLKYIFLAGETLLPELVTRFRSINTGIALENIYGPTEGTVYSSWFSLGERSSSGNIPIGKPLPNVGLYILDQFNHLQPVGVPGELCISGAGVARGYLNKPELTAEKFVEQVIDSDDWREENKQKLLRGLRGGSFLEKSPPGRRRQKIYKTGDLGRWLPEGVIEFLGRMDHQVKIRGFRIELGEIENQIFNYDYIKEAVVTTNEDKNGDKYLCAYIVPHSPEHIEISPLQNHLAQKLPDYMIPAYFVQLEQLPLTPTGKIDRKALPKPRIKTGIRYTAPGNKIEEQLVEIWSGVLGIQKEKIGIDHNFFKLGGHSLKAARLLARIHKELDVEIPLAQMFEMPTVRKLTRCILELRKTPLWDIVPVEEKEYYELSVSQKRFFIYWQWRPWDFSYNVSEIMVLEGLLPREKFARVFQQLIHRHESLRTSFHLVDGEPVQRVHAEVEFRVEYDTAAEDTESSGTDKKRGKPGTFFRPFDLSQAPLLRLRFVKIREEKHILMFDIHHIVSDGVSIGIFIKEFLALHAGEQLPPLRIQYKDYVGWEKLKKKKKEALPQTQYQETTLNLPLDFPRPADPDFKGNTIKFKIDGLERATKLLSLQEDLTLFMTLLAAFNVFLSKISGQENIMVGSPIAGRQHADLEGIIGLLINPLALQNFPEAHKQFSDFLREVKNNALEAFANQYDQYDEMEEKIISSRNTGHNPLYAVMFALQNMEMPGIEIPGLKVTRQVGDNLTAKFDMTLYYEEFFSSFRLEYPTALFKPETIQRFIGYFKKVVEQILENPHQTIAEIEIISRPEKQLLLNDFNDTAVEYPYDQCIYQLITHQVQRTPDSLAVIQFHPDESSGLPFTLTYRELNARSNRLARLLRKKGITTNTVVGIMMKRSLETLMGILGILKAGGAYLPLDSQYPGNRITSMLETSNASFLLTHRAVVEEKSLPFLAQQCEVEILLMDELAAKWEKEPATNLETLSSPGDLIYIIFTSGSTGIPKGAGVYHRGFVNLLHWFVTEFGLNRYDRNLLLTSLGFDLTQKNVYASLISGGQFCIPGFSYFEPRSLVKLIQENRVTWINCTPSMFNKLVEYKTMNEDKRLSSLRYVFLGGEPISIPSLIGWLESGDCQAEIVNTYGPTECTDISNFYRIKEPGRFLKKAVPIGRPVYNVQLYVPDKNLRLLPVGAAGELYIGGTGVGMGYINDEQLTRQKFIRHSFDPDQPEQLLYRTGDLVKWLPDGNIEFLGRIDHQVKVRGFRIEPGEIENRLLLHPTVKETLVMAREDETGEKYLCAYIVPYSTEPAAIDTADLRASLSRELPGYMVPAYFMVLERMPLNPNGKVDRNALPEPGLTSKDNDNNDNYIPPQNDTQKRLVEIWAEVLGLESKKVGIHDNFFLSGGHSLKATTLIGKIHKAFCLEIPIAEIFKQPTIKNISRYLEQCKESLYLPIPPLEKREFYPLSSAQKRLFVIEQMTPGNVSYNIPTVFKLEGKLDISCFSGSFKKLIARHESFRTSFQLIAGEPVQQVHEDVEFKLEYYYLESRAKDLETGSLKRFLHPFDLSRAPLLRVKLVEQEKQEYLLIVDMHHIISDGISGEILIRDFVGLYSGNTLPAMMLQYKDYAQWQNQEQEGIRVQDQARYWQKEFEGEIPVFDLPTDYARPTIQRFEGSAVTFAPGQEEVNTLQSLALTEGMTLYMILLAIYYILLSKLGNQADIPVGTPTAVRRHADLQQIIGMFVNTLVLRNYPTGDKTFRGLLKEIKTKTLQAFANQDYPYEELVEEVTVTRDASRNPLFDTMFGMQNLGIPKIEIPGLKLTPAEYRIETSKFDLTLMGLEVEGGLSFTFEYSTHLFKKATIERFITYLKKIVSIVIDNPDVKICDVEILGEEEKRQVLYDFNNTTAVSPRDKVIHELFAEQAAKSPDSLAVIGPLLSARYKAPSYGKPLGVTRHGAFSYGEINRIADHWAYFLKEKAVGFDTIVGIMVERSIEMVVGIMGILKAGGAYLPIDGDYPEDRVRFMLADSNAGILLSGVSGWTKVKGWGEESERTGETDAIETIEVIGFDDIHLTGLEVLHPFKGRSNGAMASVDSLAYVLYTSGSMGRPKGAPVQHGSVVNILSALFKKYPLLKKDTYLLKTQYTFDVSVSELFGWYLGGGRLAILEPGGEKDPIAILDWIDRIGVTHINFVPSMFGVFLEILDSRKVRRLSNLKYIFLAGETLGPHLVTRFNELNTGIILENIYGPTESTIYASQYSLLTWPGLGSIPIGKPLNNIRLYILNFSNRLQPIGVWGELCIGGEGLARGYLNRPELTAERFCLRRPGGRFLKKLPPWPPRKNVLLPEGHLLLKDKNPEPGTILYKTGDLARWLADGNLEFLGRIDQQVKIRGCRIELGEIENQLLFHPAVKETLVMAREAEEGEKFLCAYIVPNPTEPASFNTAELREYLSRQLPGYMVPAYFMMLGKIPLNPNGKVDRKALPEPDRTSTGNYVPPQNDTENRLAELWAEVLGLDKKQVGIHDNFFLSGGHSLKAITLIGKIYKAFCVEITIAEIFKQPTIKNISRYLEQSKKSLYFSSAPVEKREYYPLSSAQKRLYIAQQMEEQSVRYNILQVLVMEQESERELLGKVFRELIKRHESFRTSFELVELEVVQRIHDEVNFEISESEANEIEARKLVSLLITPFDLSRAPLLRIRRVRLEGQKHILMFDMHHIISDGTSMELLQKEFLILYSGKKLTPLRLQYKDYSEWRNRLPQHLAESLKKQEKYWINRFSGEIPVLQMPTDYERPMVPRFEGSELDCEIDGELTGKIKNLMSETDTTMYMVLLAVYNILLAKYCGQEDILVGSPVSGRTHEAFHQIIGLFANMLVMRNHPKNEMSFINFLAEVKENSLCAIENQDYQFEELVENLDIPRDTGRHPLIDTVFTFNSWNTQQMAEENRNLVEKLGFKPYRYDRKSIQHELLLNVLKKRGTITLLLEYSTVLYKPSTAEQLMDHYIEIIEQVAENRDISLKEIKISHDFVAMPSTIETEQGDFKF